MIDTSRTNRPRLGKPSRRQFVSLTGAGIGLALGASRCSGDDDCETEKILKPGDKIDVGGKGQEIIQKTYSLGYDYEKHNGG